MIHFQETMLQMTTKFLSTQEEVMLCYLQSLPSNENAISIGPVSNSPVLPLPGSSPQRVRATEKEIPIFCNAVNSQPLPVSAPQRVEPAMTEMFEAPLTPVLAVDLDNEALIECLLELVSERTGYPVEMLDPNLDLESDLGIDSIKRIEILNKFQSFVPAARKTMMENSLEEVASARTLNQIMEWITKPLPPV